MMKRFLSTLLVVLPLMLMAQSKIAIYDSQAVLNALPDKAQAETKLQALSDRLQAEYKTLQADFDKKYAEYQAIATDPATPASIRDRRVQEVQESDKRIQAYQQQAASTPRSTPPCVRWATRWDLTSFSTPPRLPSPTAVPMSPTSPHW